MDQNFLSVIPNELLDQLPLTTFRGTIHVVTNFGALKKAIDYLQNQYCIGFDTETKPSFKKGKSNKVSLLQLSSATDAFLFRLNSIGLPEELTKILSNDDIIKVGIAIRDDLNQLKKLTPFEPSNFIELQTLAGQCGIEEKSLKKIAAISMGIRITKGQQTSNWENEILTEPQQLYAATDAWACYEIYQQLKLSIK